MQVRSEKQPCPECGGKLVKRSHPNGIPKRKKKSKQAYYFAWWFYCTQCRVPYMVEKAKRFFDPQPPAALRPPRVPITIAVMPSNRKGWWALYSHYLKSAAWLEFRASVIKERGRRCERCGQKSGVMQVHHLTYDRVGHELPMDVVILCVPCHEDAHKRKL